MTSSSLRSQVDHSSTDHPPTGLFGQLLLPLQGIVDFFSPPVVPITSPAPTASFPSQVLGAQPRLAKAPTFPSSAQRSGASSVQPKIQSAGIRLVGQGLMGQISQPTARLTAEQILRSRRAQDGRIVISGRMRDVCAELDRLCEERNQSLI
jgi:hypothetical protein